MTAKLPTQLVSEMARHRRRLHHYLWHRVRESWLRLSEGEQRAVRDVNPEWVPPRPALDALGRPLMDNSSGEDFLYVHRRMLALAKDILVRAGDSGHTRFEGWRRVPPPGDSDYPVPEFPESELDWVKSPDYFTRFIARWEWQFTDTQYLKGVTLGQLGSDIEFTICHDMHVRWAAPSPVGYRQPGEAEEYWDAPDYDYLGDNYSSHVNPIFWKIHGWVDERVEDWKRVQGIAGDVEWHGTWVGSRDAFASVAHAEKADDEMRQVDRIISSSSSRGVDGFFRPIIRSMLPPGRTLPWVTRS